MSLALRLLCPLISTMLVLATADSDPLLVAVPATQHTGDDVTDEVLAGLSVGDRRLVQTRLGPFESIIQPMYSSTPKNAVRRLGHAAVRYTLHRFFVNRHGWFVHGLYAGQGGAGWQGLSLNDLLEKHTSSFVQSAFLTGLDKNGGLDLRGVALLAAVVEVSVFDSAEKDLRACYRMQRVPLNQTISAKEVDKILALHIAKRVLEANAPEALHLFLNHSKKHNKINSTDEYSIDDIQNLLVKILPQWPLTRDFLLGLRMELQPGRSEFAYEIVAGLAREVEGRWASWAAGMDCKEMKDQLLKLEEGTTGCVRLSDFYNYSYTSPSGWSFRESPKYLTKLGVIDESKDVPRVVISNYIQSLSNCIPMTTQYMACCQSDCEGLQLQIESDLRAPDVQPEAILKAVNRLPSTGYASSNGTKRIPGLLKKHLDDISVLHGGAVPLQSRLFAEWMHFAFPLECPFPHLAGSKDPEKPHLDEHFVADKDAYKVIAMGSHVNKTTLRNGTCMKWDEEEEMFVPTLNPSTSTLAVLEQDSIVWASIYIVAFLTILALILGMILKSIRRTKPKLPDLSPTLVV